MPWTRSAGLLMVNARLPRSEYHAALGKQGKMLAAIVSTLSLARLTYLPSRDSVQRPRSQDARQTYTRSESLALLISCATSH